MPPARTGQWPDVALGTIDQLSRRAPGRAAFGEDDQRAIRLAIASDIPVGSGLSSSAATGVGVALAVLALSGQEMAPIEVARLCRRAENQFLGVPSGLMDQAACLFGQPGYAVLFDAARETMEMVPVPARLALLVVESGVHRALSGTEYGARAAEAAEALRLAQGRYGPRSGLAYLAALTVEEVGALELPPPLDRRARHIVGEVARVREAAVRLRAGDLAGLGRLLLGSHASLRDNYEVSLPELDALVDLAMASGCLGARLMGAGFGGSVLAVVDVDVAEAALDAIRARHAGGRAWLLRTAAAARVVAPE